MENNHETIKQNTTETIRRYSKPALILTAAVLVVQCIAAAYRGCYIIAHRTAVDGSMLSYLSEIEYQSLPVLIMKFVLTAGSLIPLLMLFRGLRKDGVPFSERNARLLKAAGIMQGLRALIPALMEIVPIARYEALSEPRLYLQFFDHRTLSYPALGFCILLLFLSRAFRYGAMLQQESDETL